VFTTNLVLLGPSGSGKSTLAPLLAEVLQIPWLDLDELRTDYYSELGYDNEHSEKLRQDSGLNAMLAYWKPFEIHSVERTVRDYPSGHILAFGAGQSVYDDPDFFRRAQQALAPHLVVLLLPSPDVEESIPLLTERVRQAVPDMPADLIDTLDDMNRHFLEHPANAALADHTIYTKGRSPEETRDEILGLVER
jgi:hypothetical protein